MPKPKSAIIIGSGFGGMGSAALLAKAGYSVTVLEKNEQLGGRASMFSVTQNEAGQWEQSKELQNASKKVFRFDMGPSWYLMPDVFEHFFEILGEDIADHLKLVKLSPSYRIFYKDGRTPVEIYSDLARDLKTVEQIEPGAGEALQRYLTKAAAQYDIAKDYFMYKNYDSLKDIFNKETSEKGRQMNVLQNMNSYVKGYFKSDAMQKIMQYPLIFLGSSPYNTPALYNIMSHIDFTQGVFYPQGGIYTIVDALKAVGQKNGATYRLNAPVQQIKVKNGTATGVKLTSGETLTADIVISNADVHHTETQLLARQYRTKSDRYWKSRTLAPSAVILYLGVTGSLPQLTHHNLIFSDDWKKNYKQIFKSPMWPDDPSIYICNPNKTDPSVAPTNHENLFVLAPISPDLHFNQADLQNYADMILAAVEDHIKAPDLRQRIIFQRIFSSNDFEERYNSYKGSALGLAHVRRQTAIWRPNNISKKVTNLYFAGAGTNPGIGMPTTLISAEMLYKRLIDDNKPGPLKADQLK